MTLSSLGLGTYLGDSGTAVDRGYVEAGRAFLRAGGNVFDSAANYRGGRSEAALGQLLPGLDRDSFFISTKAGYLPMSDGRTAEDPRAWFTRVLEGPGVLSADQVVDGCHALTPKYLAHQLDVSLAALGLDRVDLFHLHNPEQQRPLRGPKAFREVLRAAFEACEELRSAGKIRAYGCATWNGLRVPPDAPDHLSLEDLLSIAEGVAGREHGFRWVQLPLNLAMPEAFLAPTQRFAGTQMPLLEAARAAGIRVQASASMMQARILRQIQPDVVQALGAATPAQAALQFARSCPGVDVALCGMATLAHVIENSQVLGLPRIDATTLRELYC
jgi:aryl-alcohol dehydrogenase-like predicted oxidoreductase